MRFWTYVAALALIPSIPVVMFGARLLAVAAH